MALYTARAERFHVSIEENKECKAAYLDALAISHVERSVLKRLHGINDNTLDKWLYVENRYPPFRACWELWMLLNNLQRPASRKLSQLINRSIDRAKNTATTYS